MAKWMPDPPDWQLAGGQASWTHAAIGNRDSLSIEETAERRVGP